jgi:hypothetical protein
MLAHKVYNINDIINIYKNYNEKFSVKFVKDKTKVRHYTYKRQDSNITIVANNNINSNIIVDYFVDEIRFKCKPQRSDYSIEDYVNKNKDQIDKELKKSNTNISKYKYYELYNNTVLKLVKKDCDLFPLFVPLSIYNIFKPKKILDMSAGWGDRLLASIIYNDATYTGVDPNSLMHAKYKLLIDTFAKDPSKYKLINSPFEDVELTETYDMLFSSPPYFISEEYSKDTTQSFNRYKNMESWLKKFMYISIDKIYNHLELGGFLILVINDIYYKDSVLNYVDRLLDYIENKKGMKFVNLMKYKTDKTIQPIFIFQKLLKISTPNKILKKLNSITNKPVIIDKINAYNKSFYIFRDDLLIGGFKQRFILRYLSQYKETNIFYRGPVNGYAQIALTYGCFLLNKKCHIILNKQYNNELYKLSYIVNVFNGTIHEIDKQNDKDIENNIINNIMSQYSDSLLLPLGLKINKKIFKKIFKSISKKILKPFKSSLITYPKRIWLVGSTGVFFSIISKIFPNAFYNIVVVSKDNKNNFLNIPNTKIYIAPQKYREHTTIKPPYPSELSYDAKIWQFIKNNGEDGDYIYNIGGLL